MSGTRRRLLETSPARFKFCDGREAIDPVILGPMAALPPDLDLVGPDLEVRAGSRPKPSVPVSTWSWASCWPRPSGKPRPMFGPRFTPSRRQQASATGVNAVRRHHRAGHPARVSRRELNCSRWRVSQTAGTRCRAIAADALTPSTNLSGAQRLLCPGSPPHHQLRDNCSPSGARARGAEALAIDHEARDMDALRPEFPRLALGDGAQSRFAAAKCA